MDRDVFGSVVEKRLKTAELELIGDLGEKSVEKSQKAEESQENLDEEFENGKSQEEEEEEDSEQNEEEGSEQIEEKPETDTEEKIEQKQETTEKVLKTYRTESETTELLSSQAHHNPTKDDFLKTPIHQDLENSSQKPEEIKTHVPTKYEIDEQKVIDRIIDKIDNKKISNIQYPYTYDKIKYIIDNIKLAIAKIPVNMNSGFRTQGE